MWRSAGVLQPALTRFCDWRIAMRTAKSLFAQTCRIGGHFSDPNPMTACGKNCESRLMKPGEPTKDRCVSSRWCSWQRARWETPVMSNSSGGLPRRPVKERLVPAGVARGAARMTPCSRWRAPGRRFPSSRSTGCHRKQSTKSRNLAMAPTAAGVHYRAPPKYRSGPKNRIDCIETRKAFDSRWSWLGVISSMNLVRWTSRPAARATVCVTSLAPVFVASAGLVQVSGRNRQHRVDLSDLARICRIVRHRRRKAGPFFRDCSWLG